MLSLVGAPEMAPARAGLQHLAGRSTSRNRRSRRGYIGPARARPTMPLRAKHDAGRLMLTSVTIARRAPAPGKAGSLPLPPADWCWRLVGPCGPGGVRLDDDYVAREMKRRMLQFLDCPPRHVPRVVTLDDHISAAPLPLEPESSCAGGCGGAAKCRRARSAIRQVLQHDLSHGGGEPIRIRTARAPNPAHTSD